MIKYLILIFIVGVSFSYELEPFLQCVKLQIDKNNDLADEANQNPEEFRKRPNFSGWPKYLSMRFDTNAIVKHRTVDSLLFYKGIKYFDDMFYYDECLSDELIEKYISIVKENHRSDLDRYVFTKIALRKYYLKNEMLNNYTLNTKWLIKNMFNETDSSYFCNYGEKCKNNPWNGNNVSKLERLIFKDCMQNNKLLYQCDESIYNLVIYSNLRCEYKSLIHKVQQEILSKDTTRFVSITTAIQNRQRSFNCP